MNLFRCHLLGREDVSYIHTTYHEETRNGTYDFVAVALLKVLTKKSKESLSTKLHNQSASYVGTDGRSVSRCSCRALLGIHDQLISQFRNVRVQCFVSVGCPL
jgi:hypothetical protein